MMSGSYTIKELVNELRSDLKAMRSEIDEMKVLQKQTLEQALKTNGRLLASEERIRSLENWRSLVVGAIAIITFLGLPNVLEVIAKGL